MEFKTFAGEGRLASFLHITKVMRLMQVSHRECTSGMYSSVPFGLAQCTVELPYVFLQCLLFGIISYWMISFEASAGVIVSLHIYK